MTHFAVEKKRERSSIPRGKDKIIILQVGPPTWIVCFIALLQLKEETRCWHGPETTINFLHKHGEQLAAAQQWLAAWPLLCSYSANAGTDESAKESTNRDSRH